MKKKYWLLIPVIVVGVILLRSFDISGAYPDDEQIELIKKKELDLTYELFGAVGDRVTNDYDAIKATHDFANDVYINEGILLTVKASSDKTYYISTMDEEIDVITNVDFNDATFIIDDYVDKNNDSVNDVNTVNAIFNVTSPMSYAGYDYIEIVDLLPDDYQIVDSFDSDYEYEEYIYGAVVNSDDYSESEIVRDEFSKARYWAVSITNSNLQYIRTGSNATQGDYQTEVAVFDKNYEYFLTEFDWDYTDITSVKVYPISNITTSIKNGTFITKTNNVVYSSEKINNYSNRNIYVNYTGNIVLENISHKVDEESHAYTSEYQSKNGNLYFGFIKLFNSIEVSIKDVELMPKTYTNIYKNGTETTSGNGTYDLTINNSVNVYLDNVSYYCDGDDSSCYEDNMLNENKWGIMNSNYVKNLFITNSKLNRVDAHKGVSNLFIEDSVIGDKGITLIGRGYLYADNVVFDGSTTMINLRTDYGSTFDGYVVLKNVTYKVGNATYPNIFYSDNKQNHDYGYKTYFPNVSIDGITIDTSNCSDLVYLSAIRLAKNVLDTADFTNEAVLYDLSDNISIRNVSITEGSTIKLFPDDFSEVEGNLLYTSYSRYDGVAVITGLDLDSKIIVHSNVYSLDNSKFYIADQDLSISFDRSYVDYYRNIFEELKVFEGVRVYQFGNSILEERDNIVSVNYIKSSDDDINSRYDKATIREELSYNSTDSAKAWLEENGTGKYDLYIGSSQDIYLYEGTELFAMFSEVQKIDFTNLLFDNVSDVSYMFYECEKLVDVDFSKIVDNDDIYSGFGMLAGTDSLIKINDYKDVFEVVAAEGVDAKLVILTYESLIYDKNGNFKFSGNLTTGDYLLIGESDDELIIPFAVYGDVTGDGIITIADVARMYAHVQETNLFSNDGYVVAGDVVEDGNVLINDVAKLYKYVRDNS